MKTTSLMVLCVLVLFVGCATEKVAPNALTLGVEYSWKGIANCSNISPAIKVTGFPKHTKSFSVRMSDLNDLGDSRRWDDFNDGSGMIPSGAFDDYRVLPRGQLHDSSSSSRPRCTGNRHREGRPFRFSPRTRKTWDLLPLTQKRQVL
jgi:hypothetical protein